MEIPQSSGKQPAKTEGTKHRYFLRASKQKANAQLASISFARSADRNFTVRKKVYCTSDPTSIAMTQRQPRRASVPLAQALAADHRPTHTATDSRTASRLSQLTVPELRQRLKESGLPVGGSKSQLVERLQTQRDQPTDSRARLRRTATENPAYRRARTRKHGSRQESPADSGRSTTTQTRRRSSAGQKSSSSTRARDLSSRSRSPMRSRPRTRGRTTTSTRGSTSRRSRTRSSSTSSSSSLSSRSPSTSSASSGSSSTSISTDTSSTSSSGREHRRRDWKFTSSRFRKRTQHSAEQRGRNRNRRRKKHSSHSRHRHRSHSRHRHRSHSRHRHRHSHHRHSKGCHNRRDSKYHRRCLWDRLSPRRSTSPATTTPSCGIPLPSSARRKVARGEYVCLDNLVPPSPAAAKQTTRHNTKVDSRKMRAITDIHTWLLAWNRLMMELSRMFPDRVSEFIS